MVADGDLADTHDWVEVDQVAAYRPGHGLDRQVVAADECPGRHACLTERPGLLHDGARCLDGVVRPEQSDDRRHSGGQERGSGQRRHRGSRPVLAATACDVDVAIDQSRNHEGPVDVDLVMDERTDVESRTDCGDAFADDENVHHPNVVGCVQMGIADDEHERTIGGTPHTSGSDCHDGGTGAGPPASGRLSIRLVTQDGSVPQRVVLALLVVPIIVGLLAVGAQAARPALDVEVVDLPTLTMATLLSLVGAALIASSVRQRDRAARPAQGRLLTLGIVVGGIVLTVLAIGVTLTDVDPPLSVSEGGGSGSSGEGRVEAAETLIPELAVGSRSAGAYIVLGVLVLMAVGLAVWWVRRATPPVEVVVTRRAVDQALAAGQRAMGRSDGDAREAILRAFDAMEQALGATTGARLVGETQDEFVSRVLGSHDLDVAAVSSLADVYRRARWGAVTVTQQDRQVAVSALDRLVAGS